MPQVGPVTELGEGHSVGQPPSDCAQLQQPRPPEISAIAFDIYMLSAHVSSESVHKVYSPHSPNVVGVSPEAV